MCISSAKQTRTLTSRLPSACPAPPELRPMTPRLVSVNRWRVFLEVLHGRHICDDFRLLSQPHIISLRPPERLASSRCLIRNLIPNPVLAGLVAQITGVKRCVACDAGFYRSGHHLSCLPCPRGVCIVGRRASLFLCLSVSLALYVSVVVSLSPCLFFFSVCLTFIYRRARFWPGLASSSLPPCSICVASVTNRLLLSMQEHLRHYRALLFALRVLAVRKACVHTCTCTSVSCKPVKVSVLSLSVWASLFEYGCLLTLPSSRPRYCPLPPHPPSCLPFPTQAPMLHWKAKQCAMLAQVLT